MWQIITTDEFDQWFFEQEAEAQIAILAALGLVEEMGPMLGRPFADTLNGSRYKNMKVLRIQHAGHPLRVFFAFDPARQAIVSCAEDKTGDEKRFYKKMIPLADRLFTDYLNR